jgi:hypothetical protein
VARADLGISYINLLASLNGQILSQHGRPDIIKPWLAKLTAGDALLRSLTEPRGGLTRPSCACACASSATATATTTSSMAKRHRSPPPTRPTLPWCSNAPGQWNPARMASPLC